MRYKVLVAYDGWNYAGWQKQINAQGIQEVIEKALGKINQEEISIVASGRTDAKVHAKGQVFHFDSIKEIPCSRYIDALNTLLPKDIRIQQMEIVDEAFHARFSALSKQYDFICTRDQADPFSYRYKQIVWSNIDIDAMRNASQYLIGTHDFTSFSSSRIDQRKPRVKTISSISIEEKGKDIIISFLGTGFLRYQVRMMVGTLIEVGKHRLETKDVQSILEAKNKEACRFNAQAQGLYLMKVNYD